MDKKQYMLDLRYLKMAQIWAENSYCKRRQVGALVVKDQMIISDGYNGTPSGFENVCEDDNNVTLPYVLHAEANAITKLARSSNNSEGSTLYITDSPCIECAKLIIQAGIKRVVYAREYRLTDGADLLRQAGIQVDFIDRSASKVLERSKRQRFLHRIQDGRGIGLKLRQPIGMGRIRELPLVIEQEKVDRIVGISRCHSDLIDEDS